MEASYVGGGDRNEFDDPMGKCAAGDEEEDEEEEDGKEDESAKTGGSWLKMCTRWPRSVERLQLWARQSERYGRECTLPSTVTCRWSRFGPPV